MSAISFQKGYVVINHPESCEECAFSCIAFDSELFANGELYCGVKIKSVQEFAVDKPDWCPIRTIPEMKEIKGDPQGVENLVKTGWNECIEEAFHKNR